LIPFCGVSENMPLDLCFNLLHRSNGNIIFPPFLNENRLFGPYSHGGSTKALSLIQTEKAFSGAQVVKKA